MKKSDFKFNYYSQNGSAALIASIVVSAVVLSIVLSVLAITINSRASLQSFASALQSFYAAESGVGEALIQLRREPNNFIFPNLIVGGVSTISQFVEIPGACDPPPECQFVPGSGWWGEYFNYLGVGAQKHPDMEVNPYPGPTPTPTEHDWYDNTYKTHEQIDANLLFPVSMWFPYDGTQWENKEGLAHDYFFGIHWRARVTAPQAGNYSYSLASDDDSWVLLNGIVVVNNSGTHAAFTKTGTIYLAAGSNNIVELYFAERHTVESGFRFYFDNPSLIITPWPEGCGEDAQCNSNIEASASTTNATREVRYTCNQEIDNCVWSELVP
ncbi:MAG: PA14 domain-containing protein [Patescibacteria group bacterium]